MSHFIEFEKGVWRLTPPAGDRRFAPSNAPLLIFAMFGCDNNVFPHEPRWQAFDLASESNGQNRPMLPPSVWRLARDADGGGIKPRSRACTGTAYIKQWQDRVRAVMEFSPEISLRTFKISAATEDKAWPAAPLSLADVHDLVAEAVAWGRFKADRASLQAAFHGLCRERPLLGRGSVQGTVYPGTAAFWDAVHLFENRKHLPFAVSWFG